MNAPPEKNAGDPSAQGITRNAAPDTNQAGHSASNVSRGRRSLVTEPMAVRVTAEANRIEAEIRDRACRCPGRAYVAHAWDLGSHKAGCRAGYAWLSVDEMLAVLRRMPRRKLAALSLAIGRAS